ncbi:MAG: ABC transporter ATP-binding protein [Myxococcales bacterium]|nr:ABC transporter ATP-binding protein [Myxococcales bacterium]
MTRSGQPDAAGAPGPAGVPTLEVAGLRVTFRTDRGLVPAVVDVGFAVGCGETLCLVGESGSGKTVSALAALGLHDARTTDVAAVRLHFEGTDLGQLSPAARRSLRGDRMAVVFQDPMTALNPYLRIGDQLAEVLTVHRGATRAAALAAAARMLTDVGIPSVHDRLRTYPHELSGGMRQRVCLAMALLCGPALLVADEPTTALDVTTQAQVLRLVQERQRALGMAVALVTHDMGVVAHMADRVVVMYAGMAVEEGPCEVVLGAPRHPYTVALLRSRPQPGAARRSRLAALAGMPPLPQARPPGCAFAPRCALADERCRHERPGLLAQPGAVAHAARCWKAAEVPAWAALPQEAA